MPPKPRDEIVLAEIAKFHPDEPREWYDEYMRAYRKREGGAPSKGIRWDLRLEQYWGIVFRARGRCEVTGQQFDRYQKASNNRRPFLPSLDRVYSTGAYRYGNVELTTVICNIAINDFGREPFYEMVKNAMSSPGLNQHIQQTEPAVETGFLGNLLPYITDNAAVRSLIQRLSGETE
ncbi:hypothetical protein ABMY26_06795 (plasmid) [Azospirillum sp. HJ39]|uniref:hypothetical protein n=1 Tax=Azospirillum sp. HJ39 TaxID=3159496 RepID=UPI003558EB95